MNHRSPRLSPNLSPNLSLKPALAGLSAAVLSMALLPAAQGQAPALAPPAVSTTNSLPAAGLAVGSTVTSSSGLVFKLTKAGKGASPTASDTVKVHYRGTLADGKEFDSSYSRGQPATFPLNGVIPCWTEGLQRMKVGGKSRLTCPPQIAYGARGAGNVIPPNATLTFEVELISISLY